MNLWIKKVVPTLAVLAVLGYCSWPGAEGSLNKDKGKDKKREISQILLAPTTAPLPMRDPFEGPAKKRDPIGGLAKKAPAPKETAKAVASKQTAIASEELTKLLAGLALKGTFLSGERRLAMINDRIYAEGEALKSGTLKSPVLIAEIHADTVLLKHQGAQVELKYRAKDGKGTSSAKTDRKLAKGNETRN